MGRVVRQLIQLGLGLSTVAAGPSGPASQLLATVVVGWAAFFPVNSLASVPGALCQELLRSDRLVAAFYEINIHGEDVPSGQGDVIVIRDSERNYDPNRPEIGERHDQPRRPEFDPRRELELPLQEITPTKKKPEDKLPAILPLIDLPLPPKKPTKPLLN